jgi:glycosyltransferase involved in cell wall biosynthesis
LEISISNIIQQKLKAKGNLISVVLPVFNEIENLQQVVEELYNYLINEQQLYNFEITFIDDRSTDGSFELLSKLANQYSGNVRISVVRLAKNSGSHIAITAGLNISRGDFTVIMASDGQDPPEVIGDLIVEWEKGNELVLASRLDNLDHSYAENFFSKMAWKLMNWSTKINMPKNGCDLLGLDNKVLRSFNKMDERNTTFIFRILSLGYRQKEITYIKRARIAGISKWTFLQKMAIMIDAITGYSSRPLRLITKFGLLIFLILIFRWVFVAFKIYILHEKPSELTIVVNTIFTSLGLQILLLGVIGDYIWRILDETRKRPLYEISDAEGKVFDNLTSLN